MNDSLSALQFLSKNDANKHGWYVFWEKYKCKREEDLTVGEALALIAGEACGEALEAYRDDDREHFGEELADIMIRVLHLAGDIGIDITKEVNNKLLKNRKRPYKHGRKNL